MLLAFPSNLADDFRRTAQMIEKAYLFRQLGVPGQFPGPPKRGVWYHTLCCVASEWDGLD